VDFVTDESEDSAQVDALLDSLARRMMTYAKQGYLRPQTFLHIGGSKLFRDEIWGPMRMVFQADYAYYRKMGYFDFPQGDWRTRVRNAFLMPLTRIPSVRKTFRDKLPDVMLTGYPKVVDDA